MERVRRLPDGLSGEKAEAAALCEPLEEERPSGRRVLRQKPVESPPEEGRSTERRLAAAVAELSHIPNVEGLPTETSRELFSRVMGYFARGEQRYDVISRLAKEDWRRIAETVEALRYE